MKKQISLILVVSILMALTIGISAKNGADDPTATASPTASSSPSATASLTAAATAVPSASPDLEIAAEKALEMHREDWDGRKALLKNLVDLRSAIGDHSIPVVVNGKILRFDVPPIVRSGRTMIPVRAVVTALGAVVDWTNSKPDIVTISKTITDSSGNSKKIVIIINLKTGVVTKNGAVLILDAKPVVVSGRTMVPIRFIAESFGKFVEYDIATKGVFIDDSSSSSLPPSPSPSPSPSTSPSPSPSTSPSPSPSPSSSPSPSPTPSPVASPSPSPTP